MLPGHTKNPCLSFTPRKNLCEKILIFLQKAQIFRLEGPVGYSLPHPSVWCVFFFLLWSSQKGRVTPEKIWDFLELAEMAVTSQTVPSFPCCASTGGSVPLGGNVAGDLLQADFSLAFSASLPQFTK